MAAAIRAELQRIEFEVTPLRVQRRLDEISHAAEAAGQYGPATRCEELIGRSIGLFVDRTLQLSGVLNDSHVAALIEIARRRQQEPVDNRDNESTATSIDPEGGRSL